MAFRSRAKTPAGVLRAAARLLRAEGWCRGGGPPGTARCLWLAAVRVVRGPEAEAWEGFDGAYTDEKNRLMDQVEKLLFERIGTASVGGIWKWNDKKGRTLEQVLALLENKPQPA